jgi:crotonobetainyl-CoA:carnitine CoA-transferase CaiB-like acyl-CoA transferase
MKLSGLKVVDLSNFLPGPYLTQILADHGATVIKIENPNGGDPGREIGLGDGSASAFFWSLNRGKKSVVLDLKNPTERNALLSLCDDADVFIEAFRPGVMQRLGIGYETLRNRNPAIVYCSLSGFGQDGPYRDKPAHDLAVQAIGGVQSLTTDQAGRPMQHGVAIADICCGLQGLAGILMGVMRARETGKGDYIDISMHESVLNAFPNVLGPVYVEDRQPSPQEERTNGGAAFYKIYETLDGGHLALGGQEIKFCAALLNHLGCPDLIEFCTLPPGSGQNLVATFLRETFATKTLADWEAELAGLDICFGAVKSVPEALVDPHVVARKAVVTDASGRRHLAPVIRFREEPAEMSFDVPHLGEHTGDFVDAQINASTGINADTGTKAKP